MSINRKQFSAGELKFFKAFDRWQLRGAAPDVVRAAMAPGEIDIKLKEHRPLVDKAFELAKAKIDYRQDWDKTGWLTAAKIQNASLYYLFTGDRRAIPLAIEGLEALERCKRPYWTFSSCIGVLDMDLVTATCVQSLAIMKCCMGGALDAGVRKRLKRQIVDRILRPGLEAERHKTYLWMESKANWRIILPGCFAMAAMACADECPEYRELIEYGIEGVLLALGTGDSAGGWNEGPGYWDYGLGFAVAFARSLKAFTGGAVDLFEHPFLRKTGDFRLFMQTKKDEIWNWSDADKKSGPSVTLIGLARANQNPAYQWLALEQGLATIQHLYQVDPWLKPEAPPAGKPVSRLFPGLGVLVWRGGFGWRDSFIGVKAGDIPDYNHHCQMDFGSVVIHSGGRELLAETHKWVYPYEGKKDPKVKGAKPGFYDIENRRWMRWDFDYVAALGHNTVTLEGLYPQPVLKAEARLFGCESGPRHEVAIIDSTAVYRPLAKRVRRYVVFLRPDAVLLVDEIVAGQPVRARVQFHPAAGVEWGGDRFTFTNGPAVLRGASLYPAAADHLIMGLDERKTTYLPPAGLTEKSVRYLYVENLYRKKKLVFVTALQFGKKGFAPAVFTVEGAPARDEAFTVTVKRGRRTVRATYNLAKAAVAVDG